MHSRQKDFCNNCQCPCLCSWPKHRLPNENLFVLSLIQILCGVASVILSGVSISKKTLRHEIAPGIWTGVAMMIAGCHGILTSRRKKPCLMISLLVLAVIVSICSLVMTGLSAAGVVHDSVNMEDTARSQKILIHCLLLIVGLLESSVALTTAVIVAREVCFLSTIHYNGHTYLVAPSRSNHRSLNSYLLGSEISHLYLSRERDNNQIAPLSAAPLNSPASTTDSMTQMRMPSQSWTCRSHIRSAPSRSFRQSRSNDAAQSDARPTSLLLFMPYASPGDWPVGPPSRPPPYSQSHQPNYSAIIDQHFRSTEVGNRNPPPRSSSPTLYEPSPNDSPIVPPRSTVNQIHNSDSATVGPPTVSTSVNTDAFYTIPRNPEILSQSGPVPNRASDDERTNDLPPSYESLGYGSA